MTAVHCEQLTQESPYPLLKLPSHLLLPSNKRTFPVCHLCWRKVGAHWLPSSVPSSTKFATVSFSWAQCSFSSGMALSRQKALTSLWTLFSTFCHRCSLAQQNPLKHSFQLCHLETSSALYRSFQCTHSFSYRFPFTFTLVSRYNFSLGTWYFCSS